MPGNTYIVTRVSLLKMSERRGIVFLSCQEDASLDAAAVFDGLDDKRERLIRSRFEYWIDGNTNNRWFHGFNEEEYKTCFVFKWKERRQNHRLYGFLCNPKPHSDARFQLCVLACHTNKNEWETDLNELDGVCALQSNPLVRIAISVEFPDSMGGVWQN